MGGAASMHFEKVRGGQSQPQTGEQGTGTLCPREQTSESVCDAVLSECESTRPLNAPGSVPAISFWTDACRALCWWAWDLESSGVLHPSWPPQNSGCKSYFPARSPGLVLSLLFRAGCIALVSGPGHFEAMLETVETGWSASELRGVPTLYHAE